VWAVLEHAGRPLNATEVQQGLTRPLAYSTIITTLGRLHSKGLLVRERDGRSHRYAPLSDAAGLAARSMRHALEGNTDHREVLARFVSDLSGDDEAVLRSLLDDHLEPEG
jgi:predicted transcriptional regulator